MCSCRFPQEPAYDFSNVVFRVEVAPGVDAYITIYRLDMLCTCCVVTNEHFCCIIDVLILRLVYLHNMFADLRPSLQVLCKGLCKQYTFS